MGRIAFLFLLLGLLGGPLAAQISLQLEIPKRSFLSGEAVPATVTLTNLSGRELVFQGTPRDPWLDFIVKSSRGLPVTPAKRPVFGAVKLPAGKALARQVDLAQIFPLSELGNFSVYAIARLPEQGRGGFQSNRTLFSVLTATPYWSQVVGVPGTSKSNEYRLIQFTAERKNLLYAQVADAKTRLPVRTHLLGESIMLRKPTVTVDRSLNMHVLYLITPAIWGHARVAPDGSFIGRDLYQSSEFGNPQLVELADGAVVAQGGIRYDPEAATQQRERSHKASDRPGM